MAFSASIKYLEQLDPTFFILQDVSNYAAPDDKTNIQSRTLSILQSDGSALTGYANPIPFPYGSGDSITISGLTQDVALQIILTLVPIVSHAGSSYVGETDVATARFLQQGLFNIQVQRINNVNPASLSEQQYRNNSIDLIIETANAQTGILYANFSGSQDAINRGEQIIANTTL